jgi:hypothetical protein
MVVKAQIALSSRCKQMTVKQWYAYEDGSGKRWRIQTTPALAEIGGLIAADSKILEPVPQTLSPRYVWLHEVERPVDRVRFSQKVIIAPDRLTNLFNVQFDLKGKILAIRSYYGEVVSLK